MRLVFTALLLLVALPTLAMAQQVDNKGRPGHGALPGHQGGSGAKANAQKPNGQSTVQSGGQQTTPPATTPTTK